MITAEEALHLAKYQTPGVVLSVGVEFAEKKCVKPVNPIDYRTLPDPSSWWLYDLEKQLGYTPTGFATTWAIILKFTHKRWPTSEEWKWLDRPSTGKKEAEMWIQSIVMLS